MAKRTRGSNRPGQRHSAPTRQQPRSATRPAQGLSAAEEARAAELEAQIVARDRDAQASIGRGRIAAKDPELGRARPRGQSPLAIRAAEEYAYVSRDVKRILRVGGSMIGLLAVFFVLIDVLHVITT
jgi:hypothetical protein